MLAATPPLPSAQNDQAATCKSQLQVIPELQQGLSACRNTEEVQRATQLLTTLSNVPSEVEAHTIQFMNLLATGDSFFGTSAATSSVQDVKSRNQELKKTLGEAQADISKYTMIVERSERDFVDEKDAAPDTIHDKIVHVLDDYTVLALAISYVFFILLGMLYYISSNDYSINSIIVGVIGVSALTLCLTILALIML